MYVVNRIVHKGKRLSRYWQLFNRPSDMVRYYGCRHRPFLRGEVELHPKEISHSVICRPRTSDSAALWGAFGEKFHRPPVELPLHAVIMDLGANVGYTAVDLANLFPTARIIAVEMDDGNAEIARRNLERFGARCVLVHAAVWVREGVVAYGGREEWARSIGSPGSSDENLRTAPATTIPLLLDRLEVERVDYVKMDIEGAEKDVLADAPSWLEHVACIKVEVHPPASMSKCATSLSESGFDVSIGTRHGATLIGIRS